MTEPEPRNDSAVFGVPRAHPEPAGYRAVAGFVKSNRLNNQFYLDQYEGHPWWPAIKACHDELEAIIPGYNIAQIKEKFGGLRYYIDMPLGAEDAKWDAANAAIARAERWVAEFENGTVR